MHTHPSILKSKLSQPLAFLSCFPLYIIMVVLCRLCLVIIVLMFVFLVCFLCNDIGRKGRPPPGIMFFFFTINLLKYTLKTMHKPQFTAQGTFSSTVSD